jgi:hypothetical protein
MVSEIPERALLLDALGDEVDPASVTFLSREPLGAGSVAGFTVESESGSLVYYVDTSGRVVSQETGFLQGTPERPEARVWLHPADPHVPALAPVAFSHAAESLLARLGVAASGAPEIAAYRPGRRAVLRVATASAPVWLKVIPPSRTERIVDAHRRLADGGIPLPTLLGWSTDGLLVLASAEGTPAADVPWDVDGLLDHTDALRARLAGIPVPVKARTHLDRRLDWYAMRLADVLPMDAASRAASIAHRARQAQSEASPRAVTIHGDLHFGQLFLSPDGAISALIDVDTAGVGAPSEDAGAFIAHAVASALLTPPDRADRVWELARRGLERWSVADGPGAVAASAVHLLGHVLGAWERGDTSRALAVLAAAEAVSRGDSGALGAASGT